MRYIFIIGCLILMPGLYADYNDFESNPYISDIAKEKIRPFLLSADHPARAKLDAIFKKTRASFDDQSLKKAGFDIKFKQPRSFIRVVSHPTLRGYLLKLVLDTELKEKRGLPEWHWFVNRCLGVEKIQQVLTQHKIKHFVAPKKWIYPLPIHPYPTTASLRNTRKVIVLLVDDMDLTSKEANKAAWKHEVTKGHLDELYRIIKEVGGHSYRAENIPQTKSGKFAFVDTEYPTSPPRFSDIRRYLSAKRQLYWDKLVEAGK